MEMFGLRERAQIFKPAEVREVDLAIVLALPPTALRVRAGIKEPTVGIAPQLGDGMQFEVNDFINIFLLRKIAVHGVIFDALGQALTLRAQLLLVEINPGFFLLRLRAALAWRGLCDGEGESTTACDSYHREGRNLQSALGAPSAAVEEVTETESL